MILSPLDVAIDGWGPGISQDLGIGAAGRLTNLEATLVGGRVLLEWEKELNSWVKESDTAVYIYDNGRRIAKVVHESSFWFSPRVDDSEIFIDARLLLNNYISDNLPFYPRVKNRIECNWTLGGNASLSSVYGNIGSPATTLLGEITVARASIPVAAGVGGSGGEAYADGVWSSDDTNYAEIEVEITAGGEAGTAAFSWTVTTFNEVTSGSDTTSTSYQHLLNGVVIKFQEGVNFPLGQTWTIIVELETRYLTKSFNVDGSYSIKVTTTNSQGIEGTGVSATASINRPPGPATALFTPEYTPGQGEIEIGFTGPTDADLSRYRICTNRDWLLYGEIEVYPVPVEIGAITPSGEIEATVPLHEGFNRVEVWMEDTAGNLGGPYCLYEIWLDETLSEIPILELDAPEDISAALLVTGAVEITVVVTANSDYINIYHDNQTGTVDYTTPVATIANTTTEGLEYLTTELTGLADGEWLFAARAANDIDEETNTDVICFFEKDTSAATEPTSLVLTPTYEVE